MAALCSRRCFYVVRQPHIILRINNRWQSAVASPQMQDFLNGAPHRKHPGVTALKSVSLPEELQRAALTVIHEAAVKQLAEKAHRLTNFLWSRQRQPEDLALRKKAVALEKTFWEKEKESGRDGDPYLLKTEIQKMVLSELKKTTYHWTPLRYSDDVAMVYLAARVAGGYAAVRRVLNEIKKRDPSFSPRSLLDFGSGVGTVLWAAHTLWGDSLGEAVCVDSSGAMNSLAERLLRGGSETGDPTIKQAYFRQFLPVTPKVQFDLVVSAFSLSELPTLKERKDTIHTLWRKTQSYLVLVENGTKDGHQILMEARDTLLTEEDKVTFDSRRASVFAPCPHQLTCPKLKRHTQLPCNFPQPYQPLPLRGSGDRDIEKFSYLVLARAGQGAGQEAGSDWARLTGPVLRRSRHVHCDLCFSDGELRRVIVTAHRHGRDLYRCARRSHWGDRLPIILQEDPAPAE
ncbi:methyltransferase-like protein 17, mitochondrial [Conger conger]|uniref:methyltransferase-like protein 17, mitochondrial n=1 Tax=Conger conger TaxID=82655 RepID=UPI002A5A85CC|nr:methyltransferase-like protein 17, mitochondrial [Conger conger]